MGAETLIVGSRILSRVVSLTAYVLLLMACGALWWHNRELKAVVERQAKAGQSQGWLRKAARAQLQPGDRPQIVLVDQLGTRATFKSLAAEGAQVFWIFDSECERCRETAPVIGSAAELARERGVKVVGVSTGSGRDPWAFASTFFPSSDVFRADFKATPSESAHALVSIPQVVEVDECGTVTRILERPEEWPSGRDLELPPT